MTPARQLFGLKNLITLRHLDNMNKFMLLTGSLVGYAYAMELFIAWYSGSIYERFAFYHRALGDYWWAYASMVTCNVVIPQLFWFKKIRHSIPITFIITIFINIGMWFERFVIVVPSLSHEFEPWQWGSYQPSWIDMAFLVGSFGWFFMWFLLFIKQLPVLAISEIKEIIPPKMKRAHGGH